MPRLVLLLLVLLVAAQCGPPPPEDRPVQAPAAAAGEGPRLAPLPDDPFASALGGALGLPATGGGALRTLEGVGEGAGGGRSCASACRQTEAQCAIGCGFDVQSCRQGARQAASFDYRRYVERSLARGEPVTRTLPSFDSSALACRDTSRTCSLACRRGIEACLARCAG